MKSNSKICNTCHTRRALTQFYQRVGTRDGYTCRCKYCTRKYSSRLRRAKGVGPRMLNYTATQRKCTVCMIWRPLAAFYRQGLTRRTQSQCKTCIQQKSECRRRAKGIQPKHRRDPIQHRMRNRLAVRICHALHAQHTTKLIHTEALLGCTFIQFKVYLAAKFQPGMTWQNYGHKGWHVGHIQDCCTFDLTKLEQQQRCFHFTNLEPQWALDNWRKPKQLTW